MALGSENKQRLAELDIAAPLDLVVMAIKQRAARCRLLGSERALTLRAEGLWDLAPGEIITVRPRKRWQYAGGSAGSRSRIACSSASSGWILRIPWETASTSGP